MIDYRFATENDIENIIKAIYDIWLYKDNGSISDAIEVSEGFAYYYRNFPDYTTKKIILAIDTTTDVIAGLAGYLDYPLLELPDIKAAQLNPVGVRKEYRRNGIASKCSEFLCSYLKDNGYSFILVCGVPYLYSQIGFHPVFSINKAEFNLPLNLDYSYDVSVKKADMDTIGNVLGIYINSKKGNLFAMDHSEIWLERKFYFKEFKIKEFAPQIPLGTIDVNRIYFAVRNNTYVGYLLLNQVDSAEINIEELFALDDDVVSALLIALQNMFVTKKIIINHCSVDSSIYKTAINRGNVQSFDVGHLFIKILNSNKLLVGMKHIFEKRLNKKINSSDLYRIYKLFDILNEEQKASVLVGKSLYKDLINNAGVNIKEFDLNMMMMIFPVHNPYILEEDFN